MTGEEAVLWGEGSAQEQGHVQALGSQRHNETLLPLTRGLGRSLQVLTIRQVVHEVVTLWKS